MAQLLGDALIGDRKTDKMTVRASSELFERVEVHSAVVLGTDYVSAATLHAWDLRETQPTYTHTHREHFPIIVRRVATI